jgi:hypothetical protein
MPSAVEGFEWPLGKQAVFVGERWPLPTVQRWSGNRRWDFSGGEVDLLLREFFEGRRWKSEILREQLFGGVANPSVMLKVPNSEK